jgi:hypothetical protein
MREPPGLSAHSRCGAVGTALAYENLTMDRWIKTAWRAFWVGLGASAVLVAQSVVSPPSAPVVPSPADPSLATPLEAPPRPLISPSAARRQSADPILTHCAPTANITGCS